MALNLSDKFKDNLYRTRDFIRTRIVNFALFVVLDACFALIVARLASFGLDYAPNDMFAGFYRGQGHLIYDLVHYPFAIYWTNKAVALAGITAAFLPLAIFVSAHIKAWRKGEFDTGHEHGQARFATRGEASSFMDTKRFENNIFFSEHSGMAINIDNKKLQRKTYGTNLNTLTIGSSGSGKSFNVVLPTILQSVGSALVPYEWGYKNLISYIPFAGLKNRLNNLAKTQPKKQFPQDTTGGFDLVITDPKATKVYRVKMARCYSAFAVRQLQQRLKP